MLSFANPPKQEEKTKKKAFLPWIEKYRPQSMDDIAHQDEVVRTLRKSMETKNLPHLLFYGPPGTGKTSTILAVARELFGPNGMKQRILELNASDERGISVVRDKVKKFAKITVSNIKERGFPCPPYKIIILDEADSMTQDAQSALRRTMEKYSKTTRFCLICNYVSRIISPITSRCAKFRFKNLPHDSVVGKLREICGHEEITVDDDAMDALVTISGGDMRKAIQYLQSAQLFRKNGQAVRASDILKVSIVVPETVVIQMFSACSTKSFEKIYDITTDVIADGFPVHQVFDQFVQLIASSDLQDLTKAEVCIAIAEADKKLTDGASEYLQLMSVLSYTMSQIDVAKRAQQTVNT